MNLKEARWINKPGEFEIGEEHVSITTDPKTDFWQRTFYGFRNDNAHSLLLERSGNFTFTARLEFEYREMFDQCGLAVYGDSDNWFKSSVESENENFARLGSVVTNLGYSDWATVDIKPVTSIWFRLSRRGPDFLIESSFDGIIYSQMRIFHMHFLGETSEEMGKADPPVAPEFPVRFGLYACSPMESSFTARFDHFTLEDCRWKNH